MIRRGCRMNINEIYRGKRIADMGVEEVREALRKGMRTCRECANQVEAIRRGGYAFQNIMVNRDAMVEG